MKILVCPADRSGCGYTRLIWPARALIEQGHDVAILDKGKEIQVGQALDGRIGTWIGSPMVNYELPEDAEPLDADVVVLQRCLHDAGHQIRLLQRTGIAVVVELDDDFKRIDKDNRAFAASSTPTRNWQHMKAACEAADLVTVSTPALARTFAPHGRVAIISNCIPESYLNEKAARAMQGHDWKERHKVAIGWAGAVPNHPGDLDVTGGAIARVLRANRGSSKFHVVGTGEGVREALRIEDRISVSDWQPLWRYAKCLAQLDVGIVPLKASAFNRAKSWLKGLEMAAVGVPFVASCTPEYERLAKLGAGRLAAKPKDWEREVAKLIRDRTFREDQADLGREVARALTIEANAWRWLAAWSEAGAMRRAA